MKGEKKTDKPILMFENHVLGHVSDESMKLLLLFFTSSGHSGSSKSVLKLWKRKIWYRAYLNLSSLIWFIFDLYGTLMYSFHL